MKNKERKKILELRRALSHSERRELSIKICSKVENLKEFKNAKNVLFYHALDEELDLAPIFLKTLCKREKNVFLPRLDKNNEISARRYKIGEKLETNHLKIREPLESAEIFPVEKIDLSIIPCVAVDKDFYRLGFGMGCYDKFLENFSGFSICPVFDFQIIKKVPRENHDKKVNLIVSEKQILR